MSEPTRQPIALLKADPDNPRDIEAAALEGLSVSMKEFGDLSGIVLNKRSGTLITGHQRVRSLVDAGAVEWTMNGERGEVVHPMTLERFPVRIVDWDPVKSRIANLVANSPEIAGTYSEAALDQIKAVEDDVRYEGLRLGELEERIADEIAALEKQQGENPQQGNTDPDDVPALPEVTITRPGDLWLLGEHRLLCGDSTSMADVARLMGDGKAWLMATDPPYGVDFEGAKYNPRAKAWAGIANDKLQGKDLYAFLTAVLQAWLPHTEDAAAFYFWAATMAEGAAAAAAAVRESGLHIQSQIIWAKNALVLGLADYQWKHENCWYAFRKGKQHRWFGGRDKTTVWEISKVAHSEYLHPMQKPVELYEIPIAHHTKPGELVLEPFSGSGTQIIAAERLKRRCFAIEIEPAFVDVAVARWEAFTGLKATRE